MPRSGILSVFLNMQRCIEKAIDGLDTENCEEFLTQFFNKMRFHLNWKKAVPVLCNWKLLNGFMQQQNVFLEALAKDFCLKVPHLAAMCSANRLFAKDTLCRLMPLVPYDTPSRYLANHIVPTLGDFLWAHQRMHNLLNFNASNPTGHYKLHLDECCDYAIVERLHLLDRWESAIDVRRNFADTSKWGNRSHFRNELHRQKPIVGMDVSSMAEWTIPESGEVEFDYNSNRRPKKGTTPVSDKVWNHIMVTLYDSPLDEDSIMKALRRVSHIIALSSMNMRKMIGYFKKEQHRAECFTMFFFRITDIHNAKMFSSRFSSQQEVVNLQRRMGYVSFFPFVQPENAVFELDFAMHDQRLCASLLVALAVKEKAENLRDLLLVYPSGKEENFTSGMPAGWQTFDKVPKEGVFKCRYVCAPEDRKWEVRKKNAEVYGFYHIDALEKEVQWWTGLGEVPEDVLKFMEFCMWGVVEGRFKSLDDIFVKIDGPEGNGEISLKEMVAGLEKLNFKKFEGKDERDRINTVFRYLDPGGEGTVSKAEWKIFEQLWREFDLSVREWVHFMMLAFGDDLPTIWSILDTENDGELSMEDWLQAADDIGYFGPAHIVFSLLDYSDDGSISFDEFEVLEKYKQEES
jgi:Ca2+-binding EF-hand superfamily protein